VPPSSAGGKPPPYEKSVTIIPEGYEPSPFSDDKEGYHV